MQKSVPLAGTQKNGLSRILTFRREKSLLLPVPDG